MSSIAGPKPREVWRYETDARLAESAAEWRIAARDVGDPEFARTLTYMADEVDDDLARRARWRKAYPDNHGLAGPTGSPSPRKDHR